QCNAVQYVRCTTGHNAAATSDNGNRQCKPAQGKARHRARHDDSGARVPCRVRALLLRELEDPVVRLESRLSSKLFDREDRVAFAGLVMICVITIAWWTLAPWPVSDAPLWLVRTRAACFGVNETGLPDAGGWTVRLRSLRDGVSVGSSRRAGGPT